jgi:cytochrome c oxidase subunit 3
VVGDTLLSGQFDDVDQQKNSSNLGMWAFLATEVMFFGGLFAAYALYRSLYPEAFAAASRHLNVWAGAINTGVLLCSSLTMAIAVHAAQTREHAKVVRFLLLTILFGTGFLGIKAWEWYIDYTEHLIPGINFDWSHAERRGAEIADEPAEKGEAPAGPRPTAGIPDSRQTAEPQVEPGRSPEPAAPFAGKAQLFFCLYFFMTGLHALHMVIGLTLVAIMAWLAHKRWFSGGGETQIEAMGLYWHFVDVVWVFLYPLLYLIRVSS